jgi:galactonate dehydratase
MQKINSRRSFLSKAAIASALMPLASLQAFGEGYKDAVDRTPKSSAPSDVKITDIKCGYIRGSLFVKIYTNQDIYGVGEGVDAVPGTYHLVKNFGQRLKGKSPLNVHRLFEDIRKGGFFQGAQGGMYIAVLSAIETALWDLAGKALNVPVYQLLGGKFRDKIRVYCDTALYQRNLPTPKDFAEAALNLIWIKPMIRTSTMRITGQRAPWNCNVCTIRCQQQEKLLDQTLTFVWICMAVTMLLLRRQ